MAGAPECFPIDRDGASKPMPLQKVMKHAVERVSIDAFQGASNRRFARRDPLNRIIIAPSAPETFQQILREALGPIRDGQKTAGARQHRADSYR